MHLDQRYLKRVAVAVTAEPEEVTLNGEEQRGGPSITIDDAVGTYLSVVHRDAYTDDERFDLPTGAEKRSTFVVPMVGPDVVGSIGYRFPGLIMLADLRTWYRRKLGINETQAETTSA